MERYLLDRAIEQVAGKAQPEYGRLDRINAKSRNTPLKYSMKAVARFNTWWRPA